MEPGLGEERLGPGHLEMRHEGGALHHYLDGKRLYPGAVIEILMVGSQWLRGAFEWRGVPVVWPALRIDLAGRVSRNSERRLSTALPIPPTALLRWVGADEDED